MARFCFLWTDNSSYLSAGLRELTGRGHEVDLVLVRPGSHGHDDLLPDGVRVSVWGEGRSRLDTGEHDCLVVCGWHIPAYQRAAREFRRGPRVLFFDTQWTSSARQVLRLPAARAVVPRLYDYCFVPGERQAVTARKLGFGEDRIRWGGLTCDVATFGSVEDLDPRSAEERRSFLFAGRYVPEKGIDLLLEAYARYRAASTNPFELVLAGGPSRAPDGTPPSDGVTHAGFAQPSGLADLMARSSGFVLPSRKEPYGVVLQEAAVAGLPLIASSACGAVSEVLRAGWNGWSVSPGDAGELADALHAAGSTPPEQLALMGRRSRELARPLHPQRWADSLGSVL